MSKLLRGKRIVFGQTAKFINELTRSKRTSKMTQVKYREIIKDFAEAIEAKKVKKGVTLVVTVASSRIVCKNGYYCSMLSFST